MKRIGVGMVLAAAVFTHGCTSAQQSQYSYDSVEDDEFAQDLYLRDQGGLIDAQALASKGAEPQAWVALQTEQICDRLGSGTSFDELVQFFGDNFGDIVSDSEQFVGNAAGYSCPGLL